MALYDLGPGRRYGADGSYNYDERDAGGYTGGGGYTTPGTPVAVAQPADVWQTGGTASPFDTVSHIYQSALGRAPESPDVVNQWLQGAGGDIAKIQQGIYSSPEAQAYSQRQTASGSGGGAADPYAWIDETLRSVNSTDDPNYWRRVIGADPNGNTSARDYWIDRIRRGDGSQLVANGQLQKFQDYNSQGVFDDPATTAWLQLLNSRVNALNTPYHNPQLDQLNGYLQKYFDRLQGPAYTPQQMDLMQTQTLDPLSRERDAARQRVLESASRRGLNPQSGIVEKQLSDLDRSFEQIRTQTQANFANKAISQDQINAQQAAGVAQALANIEQTQFNQNEQRANQALDLAYQVPQLADRRMLNANSILAQSSLNPTSLLQLQTQQEQADSARNQQLWLSIASLIPQLLPLLGVGR